MAQVSIVQFSKLEGKTRIDPEYYKKEYLEKDNILKKIQSVNLIKISKSIINFGAYSLCSQIDYLEDGVPFLQVRNIKDNDIQGELKKIDLELSKNLLKKSLVKENQVLLTIAGTIGNSAVAYGLPANTNSNQAIANITLKEDISPFFISTFLNSKYGKYQSKRLIISNVQPNLLLIQVKEIKIPLLSNEFQRKIEDQIKQALNKKEISKKLYQEAEKILLEALNLKNYKPKHDLSFDVNLNEVLNSKRIDAEYYQPKYKLVEEKITAVKHEKLRKLFDFVKGIEVGGDAYQEDGIPYLRVSNIDVLGLDWSNPKFISEKLFNQLKEDYQPQKGEILLSKDGTPGIAYFVREDIKSIPSSGILRLKLKDNKKVNFSYMTLVLNSILIQQQINRDAGGAIIKHWRPEEVKNTLVPVLENEIQEQIAKKLDESYKLRKESKELLEKAKKMVEDEIEKDSSK